MTEKFHWIEEAGYEHVPRSQPLRVDLRKPAESQASDMTIMAIAGHVSRKTLEHYSRIRTDAKWAALDARAGPVFEAGVHQNMHRLSEGNPNEDGT
jgi:hypothetical protein